MGKPLGLPGQIIPRLKSNNGKKRRGFYAYLQRLSLSGKSIDSAGAEDARLKGGGNGDRRYLAIVILGEREGAVLSVAARLLLLLLLLEALALREAVTAYLTLSQVNAAFRQRVTQLWKGGFQRGPDVAVAGGHIDLRLVVIQLQADLDGAQVSRMQPQLGVLPAAIRRCPAAR